MTELESEIRAVLRERLGVDPAVLKAATATTPLLGRGIGIDSIEAMTLAAALEQRLGVTIADAELTPATFTTIGSLQRLIESKLCRRTS